MSSSTWKSRQILGQSGAGVTVNKLTLGAYLSFTAHLSCPGARQHPDGIALHLIPLYFSYCRTYSEQQEQFPKKHSSFIESLLRPKPPQHVWDGVWGSSCPVLVTWLMERAAAAGVHGLSASLCFCLCRTMLRRRRLQPRPWRMWRLTSTVNYVTSSTTNTRSLTTTSILMTMLTSR